MKAYFSINCQIYNSNEIKIMTILSKMSNRRGVPFLEIWYDKMENTSIKAKFKDKLTASTHFLAGLDQQISTMILFMVTPPNIIEE